MRRVSVADLRNVTDPDHGSLHGFDRQIVQPHDKPWAGIEINWIFIDADFCRAARKDQILGADGSHDILRRKVLSLEGFEVQIHRNDALLATIRIRNTHTGHADEANPHRVQSEIECLLLRECFATDAILQNRNGGRNGGGVVLDDQRGSGARRKLFQNGLRFRGDLGHTGIRRNALVEKNFYDGHTIVGGGFDVLDVVDGCGERSLVGVHHSLLDFFCAQAGVLPDDTDNGDVDGRKNVGWRAQQDERRQQKKKQRRHDERVRTTES